VVEIDKHQSVLCDTKVQLDLKGKIYWTTVRPSMLYGTEGWILKNQHDNIMCVVKMRFVVLDV